MATYVGCGAEHGCNWVYRGDREADPEGTPTEKRAQWHQEILDLVASWKSFGLEGVRLGGDQVRMSPAIMEFVMCDLQRAVRGEYMDSGPELLDGMELSH